MQIFLKNLQGRTVTLDVEPTTTIAELTATVQERLFPQGLPPARRLLLLPSQHSRSEDGFMDGARTLAQCNIRSEQTLGWKLIEPPLDFDPEVKPVLRTDLRRLAQYRGRQIVFVGIGSSCRSESSLKSLKSQQCPHLVFELCRTRGFQLTILLIDPGFGEHDEGLRQIYDVDRQWVDTEHSDASGKVRRFTYGVPDLRLWTYATCMPVREYGSTPLGVLDPGLPITVAGIQIADTFAPQLSGYKGAVIVGDFSRDRPCYCLAGDGTLLAELGYLDMQPYERRILAPAPRPRSGMYRLTTRNHLRQLPAEQRSVLNRSPGDIQIRILGTDRRVAATHWAWESDQTIRVECGQDLVALHGAAKQRGLLVSFTGAPLTIEAHDVENA